MFQTVLVVLFIRLQLHVVFNLCLAHHSLCVGRSSPSTPLCSTDKTATAILAQGSSLCVVKHTSFVCFFTSLPFYFLNFSLFTLFLFYFSSFQLFNFSTFPLLYFSTFRPFYCSTILLFYFSPSTFLVYFFIFLFTFLTFFQFFSFSPFLKK